MEDPIAWAIIGGLCGFIASVMWKRLERGEDTNDRKNERQSERQSLQGEVLAGILARIVMLESERFKCDHLAERAAKLEAWRDMAAPRIDEAHEGLRAVARLDERMRTLFNMVADLRNAVLNGEGTHRHAT